jgi:hypothetical protein
MEQDKYIDPNDKARWGFGGDQSGITVGPQTVGETGGVEHARSEPRDEGATNNGGGSTPPQGDATTSTVEDPRDSLTIPQIKEQLDAKGVSYSSSANKAELLELLKSQE